MMHQQAKWILRTYPAAAVLAAALCVASCAARSALGVDEALDSSTGLTVSTARSALVFARGAPRYSRSARDYVYVGPVETNRQGLREYYLWLGFGTTLDRGFLAPEDGAPQTLYLRAGGEWMKLDLHPWAARVPGLRTKGLYHTPVSIRTELAARVTLNQLDWMDDDGLQAIRIADASGRTTEYTRWDGSPVWPGFVARASGGTRGTQAHAISTSNEP
jgi:hypothetical protein